MAVASQSGNANLYILGDILHSGNISLYIPGPVFHSGSISLYMAGSGLPSSGDMARVLDNFIMAGDYSPQIIGRFTTTPTSVTIQVWDVIDGANILVSLADDTCSRIGDTDSWRWSTTNLPIFDGTNKQFFYIMTSNLSELFEGQFFLDVQESAKWFHPRDINSYIR